MMLEILVYFLFGALFFVAFLELVRSYCLEGAVKKKFKWFVVIVKENMKPAHMAGETKTSRPETQQQCEHTQQIV